MKPNYIIIITALCLLISCKKKDDSNTNTTPTNSGYFRFTSNGTLVEINKYVDANDNKTTSALLLGVSAQGETSAYSAFGGIADFNGTGTYVFESSPSSYILFTVNGTVYTLGKALQPKSHGTFVVTEVKETTNFTYTKGTFSGVAYASASDSIVITGGEFKDRNF